MAREPLASLVEKETQLPGLKVQPQIRSGTNPHCARFRNRPNTKCPNRKCYESELVLIVTARINIARSAMYGALQRAPFAQ
uniref:Uncharacterized protein n=2 Tax=Caenorhabditis japonica TaxID=281687 RepID=A0A8R1ILY9_CAEJA